MMKKGRKVKNGDGNHRARWKVFKTFSHFFSTSLKLLSFEVFLFEGEGFSRIPTHATFCPTRANYSSCFTSDNRFEWKRENWRQKMSPPALESLQSLLKSHHHDSLNGLRHSSLHLMGICACFSVLLLPHARLWWSYVAKCSKNFL